MIEMNLVSLIISIGPGKQRVPAGFMTSIHGPPGGCTDSPA